MCMNTESLGEGDSLPRNEVLKRKSVCSTDVKRQSFRLGRDRMFDRSNGVSDKKDFHGTVLSHAEALYSPEYLKARSETSQETLVIRRSIHDVPARIRANCSLA